MPPPQIVKERECAVIQLQRQDEGLFAIDAGRPYSTVTSVRWPAVMEAAPSTTDLSFFRTLMA